MYLVEFFVEVMTGESFVSQIPTIGTGTMQTGGPIRYIASGHLWMVLSTVMFVAISILFLWLAARRINPIKKHGAKNKA